jgi:S-adenosylhomocysteine hydrolase
MNKNSLKKTLATLLASVSLIGCHIEQTPAQTAQALAVDSRVPVRCAWSEYETEKEYDWCQLLDFDGDQHVDVVEDGMKNALFAVFGAGEKIGAYPLFCTIRQKQLLRCSNSNSTMRTVQDVALRRRSHKRTP